MAKVTRFLKLKNPDTNEIFSIKLTNVKIDPVTQRYQIIEKGDNLNDIIEKYNISTDETNLYTPLFKILGTKTEFVLYRQKLASSANGEYLFTSSWRVYNKKRSFLSSGGTMWSTAFLYPTLGYDETFGILMGVTFYGLYKIENNTLFLDDNEPPYTPPLSNETFASWTIASSSSRTGGAEFAMILDNASNIDALSTENSVFYNALKNYDDNPDTGDPTVSPFDIEYGFPGKPSEPQGGDGDMKDTNEPVALNPSDITNVAYPVRCYRLSRANVSALHGYLWSNDFITNLPKLFSDPFSAIVGIQAIPYISPESTSNVIIGTLDTNIVANKVTLYYVTVDLGSIDVTEYWQNFLDYQPYTRLKLFLPYIGIVDLPTDLFMNNSVAVKYRIDIVSGACVAIVSNRENIICTFTGNCSTKIPLSNNDHSNAIGNTLVGIAGLAGSVATGNAVGAVANTASIVAGLKERIQISGSLSTAHGILINDKPFLMIERPDTEIPENYDKLKGYTSNISMKLSETSGYTKISDIKLDGLSCTDAEKEELLNMMQNGIYL